MADENVEVLDSIKIPELINTSSILVNNTYSYANNSLFYAFVNPSYYSYYYRVVRMTAMWLDGYVFNFHSAQNGIFSTRLAKTLCKGLSKQVVGKSVLFKKGSEHTEQQLVDFISNWSKKVGLANVVKTIEGWNLGFGTALAKLNKTASDGLWLEPIRLDTCYYTTDFRGKVNEATFFIKRYVNNAQGQTEKDNYFLVEHRFFKEVSEKFTKEINGKEFEYEKEELCPMVEYQIHRFTGQILTAELQYSAVKDKMGLPWDSIPRNVQRAIKTDYGTQKINEPLALPFKEHLGVYLFRNEGQDLSLPSSLFGNGIIPDIIADLMEYDLAFSYAIRDMYNGKGNVVIPKEWNAVNINEVVPAFQGLDQGVMQQVPGLDPDKTKPFNYQFEMRTDEWVKKQDNILRKIATKIGLSPRVLASYLDADGGQKTATEIDEDSDTSANWIEDHRGDLEDVLNCIIKDVLTYEGKSGDIVLKFGTPSLVNKDRIVDRVLKLREAGLIDDEEALKEIYPDTDEEQLGVLINKAKQRQEEQQKQAEMQQNMLNFGTGEF